MIGQVTCGWVESWESARRTGDDAAAARAVTALGSSRRWKVLRQMDARGDYPEVVWQIADEIAAGHDPAGYRDGLGC